jgi:hypothetical protein
MGKKKKEKKKLPGDLLMYLYQYRGLTDEDIAEFDQYEREQYDEERQDLIDLGFKDFLNLYLDFDKNTGTYNRAKASMEDFVIEISDDEKNLYRGIGGYMWQDVIQFEDIVFDKLF